jgi:hypothetical protein
VLCSLRCWCSEIVVTRGSYLASDLVLISVLYSAVHLSDPLHTKPATYVGKSVGTFQYLSSGPWREEWWQPVMYPSSFNAFVWSLAHRAYHLRQEECWNVSVSEFRSEIGFWRQEWWQTVMYPSSFNAFVWFLTHKTCHLHQEECWNSSVSEFRSLTSGMMTASDVEGLLFVSFPL